MAKRGFTGKLADREERKRKHPEKVKAENRRKVSEWEASEARYQRRWGWLSRAFIAVAGLFVRRK